MLRRDAPTLPGVAATTQALWAFVTRAFQPPTSPSALAATTLFAAPLVAHSAGLASPSDPCPWIASDDSELPPPPRHNTGEILSVVQRILLIAICSKDDTEDVLCDDDWEDCLDEPSASQEEARLPAFVASSESMGAQVAVDPMSTAGSSGTAQDSSCPVLPSLTGDSLGGPQTIPLNEDAMARLSDECDPFFSSPIANPRWSAFSLTHPSAVLAMLLASWLHLAGHLPFRFCDVVLTVIGFILADAGQAPLAPLMHSSLSGCLSTLRLDPAFQIYPTCPQCLEPHPETAYVTNACCSQCGHHLFATEPEDANRGRRQKRGGKRRKPLLRTPAKSITDQLAELLLRPGMEEALTSWRRRSRLAGWLSDFFDGAISHALLGPDGLPFFRRDIPEDPAGEIRIGLALGVDWFARVTPLLRYYRAHRLIEFAFVLGFHIFGALSRRHIRRVQCPLI